MLLSFETRKAIEENVDGCMDKETYYLARDILNAIIDDNGNPVRPCDAKVVSVLQNAIDEFTGGQS